jgi:type II restriction enzyme
MEFNRHTSQIAWETEVWIAERPEHLIHFNGEDYVKKKRSKRVIDEN